MLVSALAPPKLNGFRVRRIYGDGQVSQALKNTRAVEPHEPVRGAHDGRKLRAPKAAASRCRSRAPRAFALHCCPPPGSGLGLPFGEVEALAWEGGFVQC